jgi:uncharacterized Tic20 family protein
MNDMSQSMPTSDERLMAAAAHFFGLFVAVILWITQKDKSRFVRFQAVQAMAFDLLIMVITSVLVGCLMVGMFAMMALGVGGVIAAAPQDGSVPDAPIAIFMTLLTTLPMMLPCVIIIFALIVQGCRLLAAIQTFQGRDFRYPWIGAQVERFLNTP